MPTLKDFVAALQAGWFPALAALVGCAIVVLGDWFQLPYLATTPSWLLTTAVIVGVFSFSILAANTVYAPVLIWKSWKQTRARRAFKASVEKEVSSAPLEEKAILSYLLSTGRRSFVASYGHEKLVPMVSKNLIIMVPGQYSILEWPYLVQEDVWAFLNDNKEEYWLEDAGTLRSPFDRIGW